MLICWEEKETSKHPQIAELELYSVADKDICGDTMKVSPCC